MAITTLTNRRPRRVELEKLVAESIARGMTDEERREQRISFVYGNLPAESTTTKAEVRAYIEKIYK